MNEIGHWSTKMKHPQTNGFVERFNRMVLEEFFGKAFREKLYESVEALQQDLGMSGFTTTTTSGPTKATGTKERGPQRGSRTTCKMYGKKVESTDK